MPTIVVRFELCRKETGFGTIYYRIYKGHNRRMEFSSRLRLSASSWDEVTKTVKGNDPEACQIEADLKLLNQIITEDVAALLTMGDMISIFKRRRTIVSPHPLP